MAVGINARYYFTEKIKTIYTIIIITILLKLLLNV